MSGGFQFSSPNKSKIGQTVHESIDDDALQVRAFFWHHTTPTRMNDQPLEQERWEQNDIANVSDEENNAAHDVQQRMNHGVAAAWRNRNIDDNAHDQSLDESSLPELLDDTVLWINANNGWSDDTMSVPGIENQVVHHQFDDEGMQFVGDELLSSSDEDSVERGEPNGAYFNNLVRIFIY